MKIAWFTPFCPRSAIGHYSEAIVDELARTDDVTVFAPPGPQGGEPRPTHHPLVLLESLPSPDFLDEVDQYDLLVYNMGDCLEYHQTIYEVLQRRGGIVILHDLVLRDFFFAYFLAHRYAPEELVRHMAYSHGPEAEQQALEIVEGRRVEKIDDPQRLVFPMFKPMLHRCLGVVVHSEYSRRRVADVGCAPVCKLDFPTFGPVVAAAVNPPRRRPGNKVHLLTFGVVNPNKLVHATIEAIAASPLLRRAVAFTVIGDGFPDYISQLHNLVRERGLQQVVTLAGYRPDEELRQSLFSADVVVNLRNPHLGESSASLLDALIAGAPTVVWNHGFYSEFPEGVVCKISSEQELRPILEELATNPGKRERMGATARAHVLERFSTAAYCRGFHEFADLVCRQKLILSLADLASDRLLELGAAAIDGLAERVADELAFLRPARAA
jgi:glycosyltransferase involved in cell wall biosynthesis